MHEAMYYEKNSDGSTGCQLCPRRCRIPEEKTGFCGVRINRSGTLIAESYGQVTAVAIDPVEKKPLYHFHPGARTLSLGGIGCNLKCRHCQNSSLSRSSVAGSLRSLEALSPEEAVTLAEAKDCPLLVWTYNEPLINYEYILDSAKLARKAGLKTVLVTAGGFEKKPLAELCPHIDAYRLDIKGFNNEAYPAITGFDFLPAVLEGALVARDAGCHIEIVTNVIPGINDDDAQMRDLAGWIGTELGEETPWHITAYHPALEMHNPANPAATIRRIIGIGRKAGLKQVFAGNLHDPENSTTRCPECGASLIERSGFSMLSNRITKGSCPECGYVLEGYQG